MIICRIKTLHQGFCSLSPSSVNFFSTCVVKAIRCSIATCMKSSSVLAGLYICCNVCTLHVAHVNKCMNAFDHRGGGGIWQMGSIPCVHVQWLSPECDYYNSAVLASLISSWFLQFAVLLFVVCRLLSPYWQLTCPQDCTWGYAYVAWVSFFLVWMFGMFVLDGSYNISFPTVTD